MDSKLIAAALQSRSAYDTISNQDMSREFPPLITEIWKAITRYYSHDDNADRCDLEVIKSNFYRYKGHKGEKFLTLLDNLPEVSISNVIEYVLDTKRDRIKTNMAQAISRDNDKELDKIIQEYTNLQVNPVKSNIEEFESYAGVGVSDLIVNNLPENLIKVLPINLNKRLAGGLPRGVNTNILIYAASEAGKSLFAINMAYGFCRQELKVCYVGNEDAGDRMRFRILSRFASTKDRSWEKQDILANEPEALRLAIKRSYNNFRFIPLAPGTLSNLTRIIEKYQPDVFFIDQMRKILCPTSKGETDQVTQVSEYIRNLGKANNIITVNVCQANIATGQGGQPAKSKLVLGMSDVYMSNVSIPGDMDLMLGLGMSEEMKLNDRRILSVPKNKVSGWHGTVSIKLFPGITKVIGLD